MIATTTTKEGVADVAFKEAVVEEIIEDIFQQSVLNKLENGTQKDLALTLEEKCARCEEADAKKRCGRCKARWYCSAACQREDWAAHSGRCGRLAAGGRALGLAPGMRVEARYQGGSQLFPGVVQRIDPEDGTVDILYDDGEWESKIPAMRVKQEGQKQKKYLEKGTAVECRCASWGDQYLGGRVLRCERRATAASHAAAAAAAAALAQQQGQGEGEEASAKGGRGDPSWGYVYDVKFQHGLVERGIPRRHMFAAYSFPPPPGQDPLPPPPPPFTAGGGDGGPAIVNAKSALDQASARNGRNQAAGKTEASRASEEAPDRRRKPPRRKTMTGINPPEAVASAAAAAAPSGDDAKETDMPPSPPRGPVCPVTGEAAAPGAARAAGPVAPGACPYSGRAVPPAAAEEEEEEERCPWSGERAAGRERLAEGAVGAGCCPYSGKKPGERAEEGVCPWSGKKGEGPAPLPGAGAAGRCPYTGRRGMYEEEGDDAEDADVRESFRALAEKVGDDGSGGCSFAALAKKDGEGGGSCPFSGGNNDVGLPILEFRKLVAEEEAALAAVAADPARGPDHPDEAALHRRLADLYIRQEKGKPAIKHAMRALEIVEGWIEMQQEEEEEDRESNGEEEEPTLGPADLALSYDKVGKAHYANNDDDAAMSWFQKALDLRRTALGKDHPSIGASYINIGNVFQYRGDPGRALEYFEMSLDLRQKAHGTEDHPDVGISYYSMATGYEYSSDFENSIECYKKCLEIWKKTLGEEHELTIKAEKSLDQVLTDKEQCLIC